MSDDETPGAPGGSKEAKPPRSPSSKAWCDAPLRSLASCRLCSLAASEVCSGRLESEHEGAVPDAAAAARRSFLSRRSALCSWLGLGLRLGIGLG